MFERSEFKRFQSNNRSLLSEAGAALIFFASVSCIKARNEVGFGRSAKGEVI
ncbi:hypothetical protein [Carboxylicivirga sp. N1Y90]|uniref:hypothetical protein n=1 Tax=Carboxylicivirga fragile TaxID=3417571 RepID=UPI003D344C38|nr:hypothetical protein [Marinilabiliaceae bacterium N1Y90]